MTDRKWSTCLAVGWICLATTGCVTPYVYHCDECGDDSISGRYAAAGNCEIPSGYDGATGGEVECAECDGPYGGHTVTGVLKRSLTCGSGCGEIYWGEWINDPPADCDPCGDHGDWIGPRCCPPGMWAKLWAGLHGGRSCDHDEFTDGGCDACASQIESGEAMEILGAGADSVSEQEIESEPMPATVSERPAETETYYQPHPLSRLKRATRR